jgi:hypothetical protein
MRRDERLATLDHRPAIRLERVGRVVERNAKQQADEQVGQPVHEQFHPGIINHPPPLTNRLPNTQSQPSFSNFQ